MEFRIEAEKCTGCGACLEACPSGAIQLSDGLAILDQAACTECQACAEVCPVDAIATIELPVAVQAVRETRLAVAEPAPENPGPWLSAALAFAGREILPRLADSLLAALDRRLAHTQPAQNRFSQPSPIAESVPMRNNGRGYRRRIRQGRGPRGKGNGAGKWE